MRRRPKKPAPAEGWPARLVAALGADSDCRFAALFGSAAKGRLRADSDLDIAVGTRKVRRQPDARLLRLAGELGVAAGRDVELVPVTGVSLALRFAVASDGVLLWEREPGEFGRFRSETFIEHADMEPIARVVRQAFFKRVAEEGRGGPGDARRGRRRLGARPDVR